MATAATPKRGEIWLVDFDPTRGAEIRKIRPALVVGLNSIGRLPLRMVVPITDWKPSYAAFPWFVHVPPDSTNGLIKDSGADTFQTKSIAIQRFVQWVGDVAEPQLDEL